MAKVIKANYARVLEPEKQPPAEEKVIVSEAVNEDTELDAPQELHEEDAREAYQAAYDELVLAAQDEVSAMLDDARNQALAIMTEAENTVNELRDQAWEEGYSNAVSQAKKQIDEIINKANGDAKKAEESFTAERERLLNELEGQMLGIALEVAGKILHKELAEDDQAYLSMIREAVSRMPAEDAVSIRLNPAEYERFFNKKESKFKTDKGQVTAKLIPDPTLERFDAVIESASGIVDAGADAQLSQMKRNMGL